MSDSAAKQIQASVVGAEARCVHLSLHESYTAVLTTYAAHGRREVASKFDAAGATIAAAVTASSERVGPSMKVAALWIVHCFASDVICCDPVVKRLIMHVISDLTQMSPSIDISMVKSFEDYEKMRLDKY